MSDLGQLFRLRGALGFEPLENFTTTALAIAIKHDDRPMKLALKSIDWKCHDRSGQLIEDSASALVNVEEIKCRTQQPLLPGQGTLGYLDLVLDLKHSGSDTSTIWVEAKVEAGEGQDQIANYKKHAAVHKRQPAIVSLGKTRLRPDVPALYWSDIVDAVATVPNPHYAWSSLRDFLIEEGIVRLPLPADLVDPKPHIEVIVAVNQKVRALWPDAGSGLLWADGMLRSTLAKSFDARRDLLTTAGPLIYGLRRDGQDLQWCLVVTTRKNYRHVLLDAGQMLADAEAAALAPAWSRYFDRQDVLERTLPSLSTNKPDEIVAWFHDGLRQIREARILDRYFDGLAAKARQQSLPENQAGSNHPRLPDSGE